MPLTGQSLIFINLSSKCCLNSSGKTKGKKGGGKDKPKNVKSNTGGEQFPEVCIEKLVFWRKASNYLNIKVHIFVSTTRRK